MSDVSVPVASLYHCRSRIGQMSGWGPGEAYLVKREAQVGKIERLIVVCEIRFTSDEEWNGVSAVAVEAVHKTG
ncbi:MAG: hypothetical protein OEV77_14755 [Nitrospira sp.]|nr:hypothetical protein [Nitrospira sp.]